MSKLDIELEKKKQSFLAVIKWASVHAGARIVFDSEDGCPRADVDKKIIHMPKKVAVKNADSTLGTIIHEAMHIKHTPKWLSDLCRDKIDHTIFNGLEDARIEYLACKQLRALQHFLLCTVIYVRENIPDVSKIDLGFRVLSNIACQACGEKIFRDQETYDSEAKNKKLLTDLQDIFDRIFSVTMVKSFQANCKELYEKVDEFRRIYGLPPVTQESIEQWQKEKAQGQDGEGEQVQVGAGFGYGNFDVRASKLPGNRTPKVDLEEINSLVVNLNEQAKNRLKETLKKSMTTIIDEGMVLNTDNLPAIMTGDIDELFIDTKSERKMRTKVYFLMDVSGSMDSPMSFQGAHEIEKDTISRRDHLAQASFKAISEVIDECKGVYGTNIDYDHYVFADDCEKIKKAQGHPSMGGGTNLPKALKYVLKHIQKDDPADKRILVIMTDGDVGDTDTIKGIISQEAQDIRIVFVGISENQTCDLIRYNIMHGDHAEAMIVDAMEEAL